MKWAILAASLAWSLGWLIWVPINARRIASSPYSFGGSLVVPEELAVSNWPWTPDLYFSILGLVVFLAAAGAIMGERRRNRKQRSRASEG